MYGFSTLHCFCDAYKTRVVMLMLLLFASEASLADQPAKPPVHVNDVSPAWKSKAAKSAVWKTSDSPRQPGAARSAKKSTFRVSQAASLSSQQPPGASSQESASQTAASQTPVATADLSVAVPEAPPALTPTPPSTEGAKAESETEKLKRLLLELNRSRRLSADSAPPAGLSTTSRPPEDLSGLTIVPLVDPETLDPVEREKALRFRKVLDQVLKLRSSTQSGEAPPASASSSQTGNRNGILHFSPSGSGSPPAAEKQPTQQQPAQLSESSVGPDVSESGIEDAPGSTAAEADLSASSQDPSESGVDSSEASGTSTLKDPVPSEKPIVEGSVDRIGLANNLYATGELGAALEIYEVAIKEETTSELRIWAEFQAANCLRRLRRHSEASNAFRKLAAKPESGWISHQSQWWVDVLEQIRQLEKAIETDAANTPVIDPPLSSLALPASLTPAASSTPATTSAAAVNTSPGPAAVPKTVPPGASQIQIPQSDTSVREP